jgi:hypothetical protein
MYLELEVKNKLSFNILHLGSYLKDHDEFGALGFSFFLSSLEGPSTPFSSHMSTYYQVKTSF